MNPRGDGSAQYSDCINVSILGVMLCCGFDVIIGGNWIKDKLYLSVLFLTIVCESAVIQNKSLIKRVSYL